MSFQRGFSAQSFFIASIIDAILGVVAIPHATPATWRAATRRMAHLSVTKTRLYMGLDDPGFSMRHALSNFVAARHLPALLDAVAAVGAVCLHARPHDLVLGRTGRRSDVGLFDALTGAARLRTVRLGVALQLALHVVAVLLPQRPSAHQEKREGEGAFHVRSGPACGGDSRSSGCRRR